MAVNPLTLAKNLWKVGKNIKGAGAFDDVVRGLGSADDIVDIYRGIPGVGKVASFADDAASVISKPGLRQILGKPIYKYGIPVALSGAFVANRFQNMDSPTDWRGFFGADSGSQSSFPTTPSGITPAQSAIQNAGEASALQDLFNRPEFKSTYTSPGYASAVESLNTKQSADLENYLRQALGSATQGGQGIATGFADFAKGTGGLAERTQMGGQQLAGDIDRLYQELGFTQGDIAAQSQVPMSGVDVSGLTGVSGEMATAPDVAAAYGGGLADYLGQESTLDSQALEAMARSQAGYGASTASDLVNSINMMAAQQRLGSQNRAAERLFQAQQAEAQDRRAFDAGERAAAQERAMRLWEADRADTATRKAVKDAAYAARAQVANSFATADDNQKKQWAQIAGVPWRGRQDDPRLRSAMAAMVTEDPFNSTIRFGLYGAQG